MHTSCAGGAKEEALHEHTSASCGAALLGHEDTLSAAAAAVRIVAILWYRACDSIARGTSASDF